MPVDIPAYIYAAAVAAGGILGYVKSNSIPSISAGLLFGGALGYSAYQVSSTPPQYGLFLATSVTFGGLMGYRFYNTGRMVPAGGLAILSAAMIVRCLLRQYRAPAMKME